LHRFFAEDIVEDRAVVYGEDARHIVKSLRMNCGEKLTLCDMKGFDYRCEIEKAEISAVRVRILEKTASLGEPYCRIRLYQALPKAGKLDLIVQKATELGACEIVPIVTDRCIVRPSFGSTEKKESRLQKIAYEAAKQSQRGRIPQILPMQPFDKALEGMKEADIGILLYEEADRPLKEVLGQASPKTISLMVGSEGGFSGREISLARELGINITSLGHRILRCETAPLCALAAIMYHLQEF